MNKKLLSVRIHLVLCAFVASELENQVYVFIAQFVEHCTSIAEVMGLNPIGAT